MASSELAVSHSESSAVTATVDPITASSSLSGRDPPMIEIPNLGVSASKGKKKFMEDTHKIVSCLQGNNSKKGFFGVYDGHGGKKAADFVADNLHNNILEMMEVHTEIEEAVKAGYLKTRPGVLETGFRKWAVLCRGGVAEALTLDHTAEQEDERKRIENEGGICRVPRGAWRVHGVLSVSRSIGDAHLKDWVLAEPETKIYSSLQIWNFLYWLRMDCGERLATKKPLIRFNPASGGLVAACKELVNLALSRGSLDDITVMIIDLNHFDASSVDLAFLLLQYAFLL
ncbi:hypothetical protein L3X38_005144 [Prunus dulcis]|uniref:protein-serine/threonine phosphatase n=1 Tax=Prunus dulcis TaxID=3755 RepID=A0AAD4ZQ71_PRUDU|nr:hypothetical protein L3X38_005144 [Prunus dulcis]